MERVELSADAVGPVARGHPWVYRDGLRGSGGEPGEPVLLVDGHGRAVAFALLDEGEIAARVLGRHPEPLDELLRHRLRAAWELRRRVLPAETDAYRLVNAAGDGLPGLVVDRYGPLAVLRLYGRAWEPHLELLLAALAELPGVESVARRLGVARVDGSSGLQSLHGPPPPESLVVREAGVRFLVRPARGQKTGLFLDQRENRRWLAERCRDAAVLNLFGYTGGFSLHAALAGARRTVTVDLSAPALEDARENFRLNGLDPGRHGFERADVFHWEPHEPAEVVVCDPPSLSRGARSDAAARRAYRDLNARAGAMVRPGGLLATASCTARLDEARWMEAVRRGLERVARGWSLLHRAGAGPDHPRALAHPEGRYLKFAVLARAAARRAR